MEVGPGLVPHNIRFSSSLSLDTRSRPPSEFVDNLLQIMIKLFPEERVCISLDNAHRIDIEGKDVFVEVTSFEPMQDVMVNWNMKVRGNLVGSKKRDVDSSL